MGVSRSTLSGDPDLADLRDDADFQAILSGQGSATRLP
jgi:hypothetical protein